MKKVMAVLLVITLLATIGVILYKENQKSRYNQGIQQQIADVNLKIEQLPDLEKDIFSKCMEGKSGSATDIRTCQESTQKSMFTLSQDLTNLKASLKMQLR